MPRGGRGVQGGLAPRGGGSLGGGMVEDRRESGLSLFDLGPPPPCPARFNLARYVLTGAGAAPDKIALTVLGASAEVWRYGDLDRAVRGVAAGLRAAGLQTGERVALRLGNRAEFPLMFFGTIAAGGVAAPVSTQLTAPELAHVLGDMTPRFVVSDDPVPGMAALDPAALIATAPGDYADTGSEDPAFLVYTSGASGRPKGVLHAQRSAWARRMMWAGWYGLGPDDVMLHAGAFNWTYTLGAGLTDPWAAGASVLIHAGTAPGDWAAIARAHRPSLFAAVPGVYRQILRGEGLRTAFAGLRHGLTAGERMPQALAEAWTAATGTPVYEALGMSEISTYISTSPDVPPRPGATGRPQIGRRVAILGPDGALAPLGTPGALAVATRDPGLMLGYLHQPPPQGEWFITGDRAAMDAGGYVTYLGRDDEVMNALGYRVGPQEVEEALARHPALAEVAVAELPIRPDLSLIAAFVVPRGPMPAEAALADFAAQSLAAYKCPRVWIAVETLPRTANGKVLRRALVAAHRRDLPHT